MVDRNQDEEEFVRGALRDAGPRSSAPPEEVQAIKEAARDVWKQRYCAPPPSRWRIWTLSAAAVIALLFLALTYWPRAPRTGPAAPFPIARVDRALGDVATWRAGEMQSQVRAGMSLTSGSHLETAEGAAASIRLSGGQSLRLDGGTRVLLSGLVSLTLENGAVYFDTLDRAPELPMTIVTSAGSFRPSGTQFEVRKSGGSVELRVREGVVEFVRPDATEEVRAGERLSVADNGTVTRGEEDPHSPRWDWVLRTAPMLEIEGRPLDAFLRWVAREKGLRLEYENARSVGLGASVILHGSVSSLDPQQALDSIALSSGFRYRIEGDTLFVVFAEETPTGTAS